jgi:proteasome accessory factor A
MQTEYLEKVAQYVDRRGLRSDPMIDRVMDLWERSLKAIEAQDFSGVETEIDWVIKQRLLQRYMAKHGLELSDVRIAQLDLAYHDINRSRGLFYLLERKGLAARITHDPEVFEAKEVPPQTTRAKLRGDFVKRAQERRRDFTVDWVHLKLNDQAQRTVLCKDPFVNVDERVDRLLASM